MSASARSTSVPSSSSPSGSSRNSVLRESSGPVSEKNGFSVVAPTKTSRPSSTNGRSTSCCARLKRWTSSRKRIVPCPCSPRRTRARSAISRTSFTPALNGREALERLRGRAGDQLGDRGLAGARRAPEDERREPVRLDEDPQRLPGPEQMLLADDLVERGRTQPRRQRRPPREPLLDRRRKQVRPLRHPRRLRPPLHSERAHVRVQPAHLKRRRHVPVAVDDATSEPCADASSATILPHGSPAISTVEFIGEHEWPSSRSRQSALRRSLSRPPRSASVCHGARSTR